MKFNGQRIKEDLEKLGKLKGGIKICCWKQFSKREKRRGGGITGENLKLILDRVVITTNEICIE